jgi:hypothetical protein
MAFSICFIGNSHVAAIKQAWTNRAPRLSDGCSLTFFSAQNRLMTHLEREGRALVPQTDALAEKLRYTSDGIERIEVDDYDIFVLTGSGFGVDLERILELGGTFSYLPWGPVEPLMSQNCFDSVIAAALRDSLLIGLLGKIRAIAHKPVLIVAAPYLSERVLAGEKLSGNARFHDPQFLGPLVARCRASAESVAAESGCEIVWQNEETVAMPGFTKAEFGLNPVRFAMHGQRSPPVDRMHGNEDYGFLVLMAVLRRLDELSGGRVLARAADPDNCAKALSR